MAPLKPTAKEAKTARKARASKLLKEVADVATLCAEDAINEATIRQVPCLQCVKSMINWNFDDWCSDLPGDEGGTCLRCAPHETCTALPDHVTDWAAKFTRASYEASMMMKDEHETERAWEDRRAAAVRDTVDLRGTVRFLLNQHECSAASGQSTRRANLARWSSSSDQRFDGNSVSVKVSEEELKDVKLESESFKTEEIRMEAVKNEESKTDKVKKEEKIKNDSD